MFSSSLVSFFSFERTHHYFLVVPGIDDEGLSFFFLVCVLLLVDCLFDFFFRIRETEILEDVLFTYTILVVDLSSSHTHTHHSSSKIEKGEVAMMVVLH